MLRLHLLEPLSEILVGTHSKCFCGKNKIIIAILDGKSSLDVWSYCPLFDRNKCNSTVVVEKRG